MVPEFNVSGLEIADVDLERSNSEDNGLRLLLVYMVVARVLPCHKYGLQWR
jgi:hypothetical protein